MQQIMQAAAAAAQSGGMPGGPSGGPPGASNNIAKAQIAQASPNTGAEIQSQIEGQLQ